MLTALYEIVERLVPIVVFDFQPPASEIVEPADLFANSLAPDQAQHLVVPDLDLNCLTLMVFLKELIKLLKIWQTANKSCKFIICE